jgi:hypothetical protein
VAKPEREVVLAKLDDLPDLAWLNVMLVMRASLLGLAMTVMEDPTPANEALVALDAAIANASGGTM